MLMLFVERRNEKLDQGLRALLIEATGGRMYYETYWLATGLGAAETEGGRTGDGWEARALLDSGELIYTMRTYTRTKRWVMVPERAINFALYLY